MDDLDRASTRPEIPWAKLAGSLGVAGWQLTTIVQLLEAGHSSAYIAECQSALIGGLSHDQVLRCCDLINSIRTLEARKDAAVRHLQALGTLTPRAEKQLLDARSLWELTDYYLANRPRPIDQSSTYAPLVATCELARRIRDGKILPDALPAELENIAKLAQEHERLAGQAPPAEAELAADATSDLPQPVEAEPLPPLGTPELVRDYALGLLAVDYGDSVVLRQRVRALVGSEAKLAVGRVEGKQAATQPISKEYQGLLDYREVLARITPYQLMFLLRGQREHHIALSLEVERSHLQTLAYRNLIPPGHPFEKLLQQACDHALDQVIVPAVEKEIYQELLETVQEHMFRNYGRTLKHLLMTPPLVGQVVMGIFYGNRQGSCVAIVDPQGQSIALESVAIVPVAELRRPAKEALAQLIKTHNVNAIAIGSGTGKREIEEFVSECIAEHLTDVPVQYASVPDGGLAAYSSSNLAREELPQQDVPQRSAISLARRLQDPLLELSKIEPFHFGTGLYQQEVKSKELRPRLEQLVAACVHRVGLDVNRAHASALRYVSGISPALAQRMVEHRVANGPFRNREHLLQVPEMTPEAYQQAAGVLLIFAGENAWDATRIHPQDYPLAEQVASFLQEQTPTWPEGLDGDARLEELAKRARAMSPEQLRALTTQTGMKESLARDLIARIAGFGQDARIHQPPVAYRRAPATPDQLLEGACLHGTVVNVVDFGVFVDIGLRDSALVHISQLATKFVRDPHEFASPGDPVKVWVSQINRDKGRISLTMIPPDQAGAQRREKGAGERGGADRNRGRRRDGGGVQRGGARGAGANPHSSRSNTAAEQLAPAEQMAPTEIGVAPSVGTMPADGLRDAGDHSSTKERSTTLHSFGELQASMEEERRARRDALTPPEETETAPKEVDG